MEEQDRYCDNEKDKFLLFKITEMIEILKPYFEHTDLRKQNDTISHYFKYTKNLDTKINSYKTKPIKEWSSFSWQGFYSELQKNIGGNWGYLPNASGSFLGFW
ncbi:MAG: hypothetical protein ACJA2M_000182 [Polaribacter sp.]|jgi:hypothetical protein